MAINPVAWAQANAKMLGVGAAVGGGAAVALNVVDRDNSASGKIAKGAFYATLAGGAALGVAYLGRGKDSNLFAAAGAFGTMVTPVASGALAGAVAVKLLD